MTGSLAQVNHHPHPFPYLPLPWERVTIGGPEASFQVGELAAVWEVEHIYIYTHLLIALDGSLQIQGVMRVSLGRVCKGSTGYHTLTRR